MVNSRMIKVLLIIFFSFLSSCTSVELAANLGKKVFFQKDPSDKSNGIYKIGNPYVVDGKRYYPKKDLNYDEKGVSKGRNLKELCDKDALKDIEASISVVSSAGKVGVIGYCWGGSLSWRIGCEASNVTAAVCYYGGDIPKLRDLKPKCNVLTHFGELDKGIPINEVKIFEEIRAEVLTYIYPADHGFNCDHRSQFNKRCSEIALDRTLKFLEKNIT